MLIRSIENFLRRNAMPATVFGRLAANDPRLVSDLRKGRSPGPAMRERCHEFMTHFETPGSVAHVR